MTVPTGLLVDLAHDRQAEIRRNALGAGQRAQVRSTRPRSLAARFTRRTGVDLLAAAPSLTTAKEQS